MYDVFCIGLLISFTWATGENRDPRVSDMRCHIMTVEHIIREAKILLRNVDDTSVRVILERLWLPDKVTLS